MPASITVVEQVYFRNENGSYGKCFDSSFKRSVNNDEQVYGPRTIEVSEQWQQLDLGWFTEEVHGYSNLKSPIGVIILANEEGKFTQRMPTEEMKREAQAKVIEISFNSLSPDLHIPATESARISPLDPCNVKVRCRKGTARCTITILPG